MGVRGLHSFINQRSDTCLERVSLSNLIPQDEENSAIKAYLILDGANLMKQIYLGDIFTNTPLFKGDQIQDDSFNVELDWVRGGQFNEYVQNLRHFVDGFRAVGIQIIPFFDGSTDDSKDESWASRRRNENRKSAQIFSLLQKSKDKQRGNKFAQVDDIHYVMDEDDCRERLFYLPLQCLTLTTFAFKYECRTPVVVTLGDADRYMAFASLYPVTHLQPFIEAQEMVTAKLTRKPVLGVMSMDSDFYLYQDLPYFPTRSFCFKTMTVQRFDRNAFCRVIGLSPNRLALLGTLMGNDFVPKETLSRFHQIISPYNTKLGTLVYGLVAFINRLEEPSITCQPSSALNTMFFRLGQSICVDRAEGLGVAILNSLKSYSTDPAINRCVESDVETALFDLAFAPCSLKRKLQEDRPSYSYVDRIGLRWHVISHVPSAIFLIFTNRIIRHSTLLEDWTSESSSILEVYLDVRLKIYGVIKFSNSSLNSFLGEQLVREVTYDPKESLAKLESVQPLALRKFQGKSLDESITLNDLWIPQEDGGKDVKKSLKEMQWECLIDCFVPVHNTENFCDAEVPGYFKDLFFPSIGTKPIEEKNLIEQNPGYVPIILITHYLRSVNDKFSLKLQRWELEAFILQAVCIMRKPFSVWKKYCSTDPLISFIDSRAVALATLLCYGVKQFMIALSVAGFPIPMKFCLPWNYLDGKLFHLFYLQKKSNFSINNGVVDDKDIQREYCLLLDIIFCKQYC